MKSPVIFHFTFTLTGRRDLIIQTFVAINRREDGNWLAMRNDAEQLGRNKVHQRFPTQFYTIMNVEGVEMSHDGIITIES